MLATKCGTIKHLGMQSTFLPCLTCHLSPLGPYPFLGATCSYLNLAILLLLLLVFRNREQTQDLPHETKVLPLNPTQQSLRAIMCCPKEYTEMGRGGNPALFLLAVRHLRRLTPGTQQEQDMSSLAVKVRHIPTLTTSCMSSRCARTISTVSAVPHSHPASVYPLPIYLPHGLCLIV